jgi:shikimate kinase
LSGAVIATGGGAVLRGENVDRLKANGRLFWLDRSLGKLTPTSDRPLSSDMEALRKRYEERYPIYRAACDCRIDGDGAVEDVAEAILCTFA